MILIGAGGHARVIIDILKSEGIIPEYIVDRNPEISLLLGIKVLPDVDGMHDAIISIGSNIARKVISEKMQVRSFLTAVHSSAIVSEHAVIGCGTVIMQGAIVQSCVSLGEHVIINTGATVDHDCNIGDFVHISPNATLCGEVTVGEGSWIGAGAVVVPGISIGKWSIVGAGSVVTKNIPDKVLAFGNKCRIIKNI